jgi:hypothetical protein
MSAPAYEVRSFAVMGPRDGISRRYAVYATINPKSGAYGGLMFSTSRAAREYAATLVAPR